MPITLINQTVFDAQFFVQKGEQVVASLLGLGPGGRVQVSATSEYEVAAQTSIGGNVYTTAPVSVDGAACFLAQVLQNKSEQTYVFDMKKFAPTAPNQLQFEKTCLAPVIFTIFKDGKPLQAIAVNDSFMCSSLALSDTYSIYAVVNGITTDIASTDNPNSIVTVVHANASDDVGYLALELS